MIDKQAWQGKSSECTLYDTIIIENKATKGNGSDAIYQDGQLQIGQSTQIDAGNDVYLPSGRFIEVIAPLSQINSAFPVSITSENRIIESDTQPGTPLVRYVDGGETAAKTAETEQFYIRSQYMPETLIIGKSEADTQKDFMTYINKPVYTVSYQFLAENGSTLPDVILALLPSDDRNYFKDMNVQAIMPKETSVKVNNGTWEFIGYEQPTQPILDQDITFIGHWKFSDTADQENDHSKPNHKPSHLPDTDEELDTDTNDEQPSKEPENSLPEKEEHMQPEQSDELPKKDDVADTSAITSYKSTFFVLVASLLVLTTSIVRKKNR